MYLSTILYDVGHIVIRNVLLDSIVMLNELNKAAKN